GLWTQSQLKPTGNQAAYLERDIDKEVGVAGTNAVKTDVAWVGAGYSFALNSVRQAAEGIEKNSKDKARPYVVAVDGWAGTQRYSTLWSGDQYGGDWEYIRFHIPTYIGTGLSGNPNVGSDMDGIFGGNKPIIQTRDFQWKAFTPLQLDMDGWGSNAKNPYVFGEPYTSINRMYLKLKGEMMPYIYSIANEATTNGMPMVRAMMLEYPNAYTYGTATEYQYMWGENMLVAPIYQNTASDTQGNDIRNDIYLPDEDQIWIDYFTGEHYRGGGVINNFEAPVWKLPLFIKNGAIIPMANENNTPETINSEERKFEVYPSGDTSFEVYEDDGLTTDYKDGKSATTLVTSSAPKTGKGTAVISTGLLTGSYDGIVTERTTEFVVNVSEKPSELGVKVGGSDVALTEAKSLEEYNAGTNMYFYDQTPNLNKYATEGSEFANVEMNTTPKVYVKVDKTDVTKNEVELTVKDFVNTQDIGKNEINENLSAPANLRAPEELITPTTIDLAWDAVEGATGYEVEIDGTIFKGITEPNYKHIGLEYDSVYNYRVRSINKDGYSEWSEVLSPRTSLDPYRNVPKGMEVIWKEGHYGSSSPDKAVDGDETSDFHSAGNAIDKPVIFDMKMAYEIEKLDLLFRNYGNGTVKRAEVYSSLDGINYEKVYSNVAGTGLPQFDLYGKANTIEFDKPIKARYFKIIAKESIGNFFTMREFRPYKVDGTSGKLVGDWNNSGTIEEGDLVFLQNYTGLTTVDADWDYVSAADLNGNGIIDAYDIAYVASQLEGGVKPTTNKFTGELMLVPSKTEIKAGETFTVDVVGTGLSDVNAFSVEIPLDINKYEFVKAEGTVTTAEMDNLSKVRVHSDGSQAVYSVFTNVGNKPKISGTEPVSRITLKAKSDVTFDLEATHAMLVDSKMTSKEAIAKIVDVDSELPQGKPSTSKVAKEDIKVSGDETQLQTGMGLNKLIDGTTSSDDSSRMDLKWVFTPDQADKGTLPFEMTFEFNEPKELDNITIYNRMNSSGTINIAAMKKVKAVGYLNGVKTELGEIANISTGKTIFNLEGKVFDKVVITALESHKDKNTLAINEIEFYEKKGKEADGIQFTSNEDITLYQNKITPISAKVTPEDSNSGYYRIHSENPDVVEVVRVDSGDTVNYYLRGIKAGTTNITATTANGKFTVKKSITVGEGVDKTGLVKIINEGKEAAKLNEIYTKETYDALVNSLKAAEEILNNIEATELEVSRCIVDVRNKINGLKERSSVQEDVIDFNKLTAIHATNYADSDYPENAVDGDEGSIWHSGYQASNKLPVSITIELDEVYKLNQVDYLPRQSSRNGHVTKYMIETSLDNENWTESRVGYLKVNDAGSALEDRGYNPIRFNGVEAKYLRFTALETLGDTNNKYASVAELKFYGQEVESSEVDKTKLTEAINNAEAIVKDDYTLESFAILEKAIEDAKVVLIDENATDEDVTNAITNIEDAIKGLVAAEIVVSKVSDLKATSITNSQVSFTWSAPVYTHGLVEYVIYKDGKVLTTVPAGTTEATVDGLKANTIYGLKVTAKYSNGEESKPQSINVRTTK
ncbi:discoidin domain-containing protein, partial [Clostridium sp.]|uniref:discoidin domain-containing protein n=1 Tax=Clostridium sp. TaxID=1506 RepID=UPI003F2E5460